MKFIQWIKPNPENRKSFLIATLAPLGGFAILANAGFAPGNNLAPINAGIFVIASLIIFLASPSDEESEAALNRIIKKAVRKFGTNLSYNFQKKCTINDLRLAFAIDEHIDKMTSTGEFQYRSAETNFSFYFINAENTHGKNSYTVIDGVVVFAQHSHRIEGNTHILPDVSEAVLGVDFSKSFRDGPLKRDGLIQIRLESGKFERFFRILTSNQIEARVVLTPLTQERLVEFVEKFKLLPTIILNRQSAVFNLPSISLGTVTAFQQPNADQVQKTIQSTDRKSVV